MREVSALLGAIAENPLRFPVIYRDARRAQVPRFPFGVFFVIRDHTIYDFRITHLQRHPKQWKKHIPAKRRRPPKEAQ